jgi:hypothetical protein
MNITVTLEGYAEAVEIWGKQPVRRAAIRALKKVSKQAVTVLSTEVRSRYNIKKSDLDPRVKITPPKGDDLTATITLSGYDLPLAFFGPRQFVVNRVITRTKAGLKTVTRKRAAKFQGVEVEVLKGKRTQLKSAFLMNMKVGRSGAGVMQRRSKKRLPTREKGVISIAAMAQNSNVEPTTLRKVQTAWDTVFAQELNYQLNVEGKQ